jgi:two-component system chemotaxis response regulator CheY
MTGQVTVPELKTGAAAADTRLPVDERGAGMRVVVVDDQEVVRKVVGHLLTQAGHAVVASVADGREAFLRTLELEPDAVILDLGMPQVDGIAALRLLREIDPDLRIIVHTAYDDPALGEALQEAGATAVVVKSEDPQRLLQAVAAPANA